MANESYVSTELTHLTGFDKSLEEARRILEAILSTKRLGTSIATTDPRFAGLPEGGVLISDDWEPAREDEFFWGDVVCLCDIPNDQLWRHAAKYGVYGIAFKKPFLVAKGANPVFYIDRQSIAHFEELPLDVLDSIRRGAVPGTGKRVGRWSGLVEQLPKLKEAFHPVPPSEAPPTWVTEQLKSLAAMLRLVEQNFLLYAKAFDSSLPLDHLENYYMEREWRLLGPVAFEEADIAYVYAPSEAIPDLLEEFPFLEGRIGPIPSAPEEDTRGS